MMAKLVNRTDGKWHIEVVPDTDMESNLLVSITKPLLVHKIGGLLLIEVDTAGRQL
jgi:hypothetical protein